MSNSNTRPWRTWRTRWLGLVACLGALFASTTEASAQNVSAYTFSEAAGSYAALGGTSATGAVSDDGSVDNIGIGFTFQFGSGLYTTFSINANGWIRLGGAIPGTPWTNNAANWTSATYRPIIAPVWDDNNAASGAVTYSTVGSAGSRVLTVDYNNVYVGGGGAAGGGLMNYQVKLFETTNVIQFIYGTMTSTNTVTATIGISDASGYHSVTPAATSTSSTAAANHAINATVLANTANKMYTFTPPPPPACPAVLALAISGVTTSSVSGSWNVQPAAGAYNWEVRTSGAGGSGATGLVQSGNVATNSVTVGSLAANTTYNLWVQSDCNASSNGTSTWAGPVTAYTGYCVPTYTYTGDYISAFSTTSAAVNINNPSGGASAGNYGNFTATAVQVAQNAAFGYSVSYVGGTNGVRVWVDWNNNMVFEAGELMSSIGPAASPQTGTITVPNGTALGSYRMRVRAAYNALPVDACSLISYGEVEDYTLTVVTPPACLPVTALSASGAGLNTANISWTCTGCTGTYIVEYGLTGFTPGLGGTAGGGSIWTGSPVAGSPITLTGLSASSTYQVYVRQSCGVDGYSANEVTSFQTQTPGQFGIGTGTTTNFPINSCFGYNYSQQIYLGSDYNTPANTYITHIRFYYATAAGPANWNNWTVYMGNTAKTAFTSTTDWVPLASMSQVFSGALTVPAAGNWMDITLTSPFLWDGTSNIVIAIDENVAGFNCTAAWRTYTASGNRGLLYYSDGTNPDPNAPPTANAGPSSAIAQLQLGGTPPPSCLVPAGFALNTMTTTSLGASWTASPGAGSYNWEVRTSGAAGSGATGLVQAGNTTGTNFTTSVTLTEATTYFAYVQSDCAGSGLSLWSAPVQAFTGYCTPVAASTDGQGIVRVVFSNVDNNTADVPPYGYGNFSALVGNVSAGAVVPVAITYATGYAYGTRIWIDWNQDLDFADAGEEVYSGTSGAANPFTLNASFTVPPGQAVGTYRMRIGGRDGTFGLPVHNCASTTWSTYEDYSVSICAPPVASATVVDDCVAQTYQVSVTASSLGSGSSAVISYTVNGVAQTAVPYTGPGTLLPAQAVHTTVVASLVTNDGCSVALGSFHSNCSIELDCGTTTPITITHCYSNNDTRTWTFVNPEVGGTVALKFISGNVEVNDNILLWDGAVGGASATPSTLTGALAGALVTTTGTTLSISIATDGSNSCADGGAGLGAGWVFQARCGGCVEPAGLVTADPSELGTPEVDCVAGTFNAYVGILDNGIDANTALPPATVGYRLFVNNVAQPDVTGLPGGDYYLLGSFPLGTELDVMLLHEDQATQSVCNTMIETDFTVGFNACPPDNDQCAAATPFTINPVACTPGTMSWGTTRGADGAFACDGTTPVQDVWYSLNTAGYATVFFQFADSTATQFGVDIYEVCGDGTPECVSAEITAGGASSGTYNMTVNGEFLFRVFTTAGNHGAFKYCFWGVPSAPGDECSNAIDLSTLPGTYSGSTTAAGIGPDFNTLSCGTNGANDMVFYIDVANGEQVNFTHASPGYDSMIGVSYGATCPGSTSISCWDEPDDQTISWTNTTGSAQRVWWVQDGYNNGAGTFNFSWTLVAPCAGEPTPGNTISSSPLVCEGRSVALSLQNTTAGSGVTYQWEYTTDGGTTWQTGGTTATWSHVITVPTEYRCTVTCTASGLSAISTPVSVGIQTNLIYCHCIPSMTYGCTDTDVIARVQLNTLDNNSGTACSSGELGYMDYTTNPALTTTLQAGNSYNCTITVGPWSEGIAVWIDYNDDGVFSHPEERVGFTATTISAGASLTFPIALACNPPLGTHRMRVRARFSTNGSTITPCDAGTYGEVEDYLVTITAPPSCPTASGLVAAGATTTGVGLTWNVGCTETAWVIEYGTTGFALGSGTQVAVTGTAATSLSGLPPATAHSVYVYANCGVDGLSAAFGPVNFTTLALPPANDEICGAIPLTVNTTCTFQNGTTQAATNSVAIPSPGCGGFNGGDVWYSAVVPSNGILRFDSNTGVVTDGGMAVYTSDNNTCSGVLTFLECDDDDSDNGLMPRIDRTGLTPFSTVFIRIWEYNNDNPGTFQICVRTPPPPPANDECAGAVTLPVSAGLSCTAQTAGTLESASASSTPSTCDGAEDDDVWYRFTATSIQHVITLSSITPATTVYMQLLSGDCGTLAHVACGLVNSYTTPNTLVPGTVYYVRVYSSGTTAVASTFNLCVTTPPVGPPANDECAGAINLPVNAGQTCVSQTFGTVFGATGVADATCAGGEDDDVWYSFVAGSASHTVSLNNVLGNSTTMNFQVLGGSCGTLTSIVCSNSAVAPTAFATGLTVGSTYYVRVYTNATGTFNTTFNVCVTSPPANDLCANAIPVACNTVVSGSTVGATSTGRPTTDCNETPARDPFVAAQNGAGVWYTVQGWGGPMTASLCGSGFDTQIGIFSGSCGSFTCVAGNDDDLGGCTPQSRATWTSVSGTTYYVYVTSWLAATTGSFTLSVTCGSTAAVCPANGVNLEFQNDANPGQVTWAVLNAAGNLTVLSGADPVPANGIGTQALCLPNGCYQLRVLDSAGDGMTTGGYELRTSGSNIRIIDNTNNFSNGSVSAIANGGTFCLPVGTDKPIFSSCDKLDWVNNKFIVCHANALVTAQYGVSNANSGYEFWFFDPNGSYSFRRFRSHATSDGYGTGATRACHFKLNGWSNSVATPHIPANTLLNVRVRGRVAGTNLEFGPACLFKIDATLAACPRVKLQDDPANTSDFSCGVFRNFGGGSSPANRIYANPPQPIPVVASSNVRYQFRFRIAGEGVCIVRPPQTSAQMTLNWNATSGAPLQCTKTYEVDVRVSLDGGATWCFGPAGNGQAAACADTEDWGKVCNVTINPCAQQGGGNNSMATSSNSTFTMYPNPNRGDQLFLSVSSVEEGVQTVSVDIFDLTGKRVMARTIAVQDGFVNTNMELNGDIAGGLYVVNITAGTKTYTERLVIQP